MELILASASPRRSEILKNSGYSFKVIKSNYNENILNNCYSEEIVKNCAYNKGYDVGKDLKDCIVVSADTVVVLENIILGKPKDKNEAFEMLKKLSDKTHFVATAVCLINKQTDKVIKGIDITYVTFRKINEDEIINYIEKSNPLDKAGSYGIQDKGFNFAININGELDNVIGFPIKLFERLFNYINLDCHLNN